jgi:hypothetical protein
MQNGEIKKVIYAVFGVYVLIVAITSFVILGMK